MRCCELKLHKTEIKKCAKNYGCKTVNLNETSESIVEQKALQKNAYEAIIIDFSLAQFIDEAGVKCLQKILAEYKNEDVKVLFANLNGT